MVSGLYSGASDLTQTVDLLIMSADSGIFQNALKEPKPVAPQRLSDIHRDESFGIVFCFFVNWIAIFKDFFALKN